MKIIDSNKTLDLSHDIYPGKITNVQTDKDGQIKQLSVSSTFYGYVFKGNIQAVNLTASTGQYFCFTATPESNSLDITVFKETNFFMIERIGFKGQNQVGGPLEETGRLVYIDGCSDSLIIYPPRLGDPSLNYLFFPEKIEQTFHIHPSYRLGVVIDGEGQSDYFENSTEEKHLQLKKGVVFYLPKMQKHRFKTFDKTLKIVAFHPDGDWGPTDHNHTMLNRTYIGK
jgi:hypothetical protein